MQIQTPFVTPFVSIREFGAIPDDTSKPARAANSSAFELAQASMQNAPLGYRLFVPAGRFYLDRSLHIQRSLELFGTGIRGESVLMLPPGASVVVDPPTEAAPDDTGADCVIRELRIESEEDWVFAQDATVNTVTFTGPSTGTPGIALRAYAIVDRVYLTGFTGTAIEIIAGLPGSDANQWRVHDVYIKEVGGHGIHVDGGDANGGFCSGAKIFSNGGNGIYDSAGGSTWVGCYVEEARGRGYHAENSPGNAGQVTFVGCFSEAAQRSRLAPGGAVWIGGTNAGFTDDTEAFIVDGFAGVWPFELRNPLDQQLRLLAGYHGDPGALLGWQAKDGADFWLLRWDPADELWRLEDGAGPIGTFVASYLTGTGYPRGRFLQGFPELLLGNESAPMKIGRGSQPAAGTGAPGDVVYNASPTSGGHIGWVCTTPTGDWKPFGKIE